MPLQPEWSERHLETLLGRDFFFCMTNDWGTHRADRLFGTDCSVGLSAKGEGDNPWELAESLTPLKN